MVRAADKFMSNANPPAGQRKAVRSGQETIVLVPQDVPIGAMSAWVGRYIQDRKLSWPS